MSKSEYGNYPDGAIIYVNGKYIEVGEISDASSEQEVTKGIIATLNKLMSSIKDSKVNKTIGQVFDVVEKKQSGEIGKIFDGHDRQVLKSIKSLCSSINDGAKSIWQNIKARSKDLKSTIVIKLASIVESLAVVVSKISIGTTEIELGENQGKARVGKVVDLSEKLFEISEGMRASVKEPGHFVKLLKEGKSRGGNSKGIN